MEITLGQGQHPRLFGSL